MDWKIRRQEIGYSYYVHTPTEGLDEREMTPSMK